VLLVSFATATRSTGTRRAVLFAFTCGALFGITAALTKASVGAGGRPLASGALAHWEPYALAVMGALGFVLNQRGVPSRLPPGITADAHGRGAAGGRAGGITMLDETVSEHGAGRVDRDRAGDRRHDRVDGAAVALGGALDEIHEHELADVLNP